MPSARFRRIRGGLGVIFACLLLVLGLFTLTGTASAHTTHPLHTHATSTSVLDAQCPAGTPREVCALEVLQVLRARQHCPGGTPSMTFAKSHKSEPPKLVCKMANGVSSRIPFYP